jgi:hypothetical protein
MQSIARDSTVSAAAAARVACLLMIFSASSKS